MDTPDVMDARASLEAAVAAPDTPDAAPQIDALIAEVEKQAVELVKQEAPAAVDAIEMAIPLPKTSWKKHLVLVVEKCVSTFAFAFLGLMTATNLSDPAALKAAGVAGGFAVAVYLKGVAGTYANTPTVA